LRLHVNNPDQTKVVDRLTWQIDAVRGALSPIGFGEGTLHATLCFTSSEWSLLPSRSARNGVLITSAANLVEAVRDPGPFDAATIEVVAHELSSKLPASR
jgi:hypothetical protein